ncbi:MAG: hypothetical protein KAU20_06470 [Nanoarchaeota archaeon]|nr:hypothetical protein [Nanoarchaeota archaeon]
MGLSYKNAADETITSIEYGYKYFPGVSVFEVQIEGADTSNDVDLSFTGGDNTLLTEAFRISLTLGGTYTATLNTTFVQDVYKTFFIKIDLSATTIAITNNNDAYDNGLFYSMVSNLSYVDNTHGTTDTIAITIHPCPSFDLKEQQQNTTPNLIIGSKSDEFINVLESYGQEVEAWYVPQAWFYGIPSFELEERVFKKVKCFIYPQQRTITSTEDALPGYDYDNPAIYLSSIGPDSLGWITNTYNLIDDFKGTWYFILPNNRVYAANRLQPMKIGDQTVCVHGHLFLQTNLCVNTLGNDKRSPVVANAFGIYERKTDAKGTSVDPRAWDDTVYGRVLGTYKEFLVETWTDPHTDGFTTAQEIAWGILCDTPGAGPTYCMFGRADQFHWWGYMYIGAGFYWIADWILQVYLDSECTIPVTINAQDTAHTLTAVPGAYTENRRKDDAHISAGGLVTLTTLGATCVVNGSETIATPDTLYVRYRPDDFATYNSVSTDYS